MVDEDASSKRLRPRLSFPCRDRHPAFDLSSSGSQRMAQSSGHAFGFHYPSSFAHLRRVVLEASQEVVGRKASKAELKKLEDQFKKDKPDVKLRLQDF